MKLLQSKPQTLAVGELLCLRFIPKDGGCRVLTVFDDRDGPAPVGFDLNYACVKGFSGRHGDFSLVLHI